MEKFGLVLQQVSKKRIIGSMLFGFIMGSYLESSVTYSVPVILSLVQRTDIEIAEAVYNSSFAIKVILRIIIPFIVSLTATFLVRKGKIFIGFFANSLSIILLTILLATDIYYGYFDLIWKSLIQLILVIAFSVLGTISANSLYSHDLDLDIENERVTIFGIRWFHYFWILPFCLFPFTSSFILVVYAGVLELLAELYYGIHPSFWLNLIWWIYFFIIPILLTIIFYIILGGFSFFFKFMQNSQVDIKGWRKLLIVLACGFGAPLLSWYLTVIVLNITHNMPKPV